MKEHVNARRPCLFQPCCYLIDNSVLIRCRTCLPSFFFCASSVSLSGSGSSSLLHTSIIPSVSMLPVSTSVSTEGPMGDVALPTEPNDALDETKPDANGTRGMEVCGDGDSPAPSIWVDLPIFRASVSSLPNDVLDVADPDMTVDTRGLDALGSASPTPLFWDNLPFFGVRLLSSSSASEPLPTVCRFDGLFPVLST